MTQVKPDYTPEQQKVIDLRDCNILVSAAAGSGKTAVLVERILKLISDPVSPVDVDTLLVVTFTRAAAAQMRDKIRQAITDALEDHPDDRQLLRQSALIHNASITTIDSFCQYVLKNTVSEGDHDPDFRIMDENENKLLEADVLSSYMERLYGEADEDFESLVDHLVTGSDDKILTDAITLLYTKSMSGPWPKRWLSRHALDYRLTEDGHLPVHIEAWLMKRIGELLSSALEDYTSARSLALEAGLDEKNVNLIESEYESVKAIYEELSGGKADYESIRAGILDTGFSSFSQKKGANEDHAGRVLAKSKRDHGKAVIEELQSRWVKDSYESLTKHISSCEPVINTLCDITCGYIDELGAYKKEKKLMSFADCEHAALDILVRVDDEGNIMPTEAAVEFRDRFSYVFIDEYQDSNQIQELILSAVSGEDDGTYNRFMVGDIKQSIYRFRQADPGIFMEKYHDYIPDGKEKCRIDLNRNFRSRSQVLMSANALFEGIMSEECGGCVYDEAASLKTGAVYPEGDPASYTTELVFADRTDDTSDEPSAQEHPGETGRAQLEAETIAGIIHDLMETPLMISDRNAPDGLRPVRYSDIVILYRSGMDYALAYKEALEAHDIPVHLTGSKGYFATYEIRTLMNLLRIIVNPLQDIYFYGVMESVFGSFTPEEISVISIAYRHSLPEGSPVPEGYLYYACRYASQSAADGNGDEDTYAVSPELSARVRAFLAMIEDYRDMSEYMAVEDLIMRIITDNDYMMLVSAMRGGDRREANVDMLVRKASEYASTSYFGLYNFIRYIDTIQKSDTMDAEAEIVAADSDVVRIMTTHKSKGLEFPVCIVTRMANRFNMQDASGTVIADYEAGIGIPDVDVMRRISYDTLVHRYVSDIISRDTLAEEMRILYVAMTRAKEKLILTCAGAGAVDGDGIYTIKRPGRPNRYVDWYLSCICDEIGADSFSPQIGGTYLPGMHIRISLADTSDGTADERSDAEDLDMGLRIEHLKQAADMMDDDNEYMRYLSGLYNITYPHTDLKGLYSKTSVSELKAAHIHFDDEAPVANMYPQAESGRIPVFVSGSHDRAGATVRGSAFHRIMELMDFTGLHNTTISDFLDRYLAEHRISPYERDIFKDEHELELLIRFFEDPLADRMRAAMERGELHREAPFMMGIGADRLSPEYPADETVLIQGIIDAWWMEEDGAVILDYKTDRVSDTSELISRYAIQLDLYAQALQAMRIPVKEKLIYSFELGETVGF